MRITAIVFILVLFSNLGYGEEIFVPTDQPTIQLALHAAANGDTVWVEPGTYYENLVFLSKAITVKSVMGPAVTLIDGGQVGTVVSFMPVERDTVLDGFTITNGLGLSTGGGGIYCYEASPTIQNNRIVENISEEDGGGIECSYSEPLIQCNTIENNTAIAVGGGICCDNSDVVIIDNAINNNTAEYGGGISSNYKSPIISCNLIHDNIATYGGGIYCNGGSSIIDRNRIFLNQSNNRGGGLFVNSNAYISNDLIYLNESAIRGGGIYISHSNGAIIIHCTLYNNSANYGGGMTLKYSDCLVVNTILWENAATTDPEIHKEKPCHPTITYCDVTGGYPGEGNLGLNPCFVDPDNGDFHLLYTSPCRDTGTTTEPPVPEDFEGDPRIDDFAGGGIPDRGADEFYAHLYVTGDTTPCGEIELKYTGLPGSLILLWFGSGELETPLYFPYYGYFYLAEPLTEPIMLIPIGSSGLVSIPLTLPDAASSPAPYDVFTQALIGRPDEKYRLTNLCVVNVE